ncbi:MAG: TRAP transporter substrate-binding protein DctP, partial [Rhizobacter sp.]|nr:TRAP transporter substrate-binding protein DctP [Rhizobacter sp.]
GVASQEPAAMVTNMYFFFEDNERDCVLDEHMLKPMRELLAAKNLYLIGWYDVGSSGLGAKRKITSPADVKGIKIAYSPAKFATDFWKLYGAVPVATPAPEWPSSLGAGLTDAAPTPPVYYVAAGVSKVAPVFIQDVPQVTAPGLLIINKGVWDKLSVEQRAAITEGNAKVPATQIRQEVKDFEQVMLKKHVEAGGQVVHPTAEEMAEWKKPLDAFYEAAMKEAGPAGPKLLAQAKAAKAACKKK